DFFAVGRVFLGLRDNELAGMIAGYRSRVTFGEIPASQTHERFDRNRRQGSGPRIPLSELRYSDTVNIVPPCVTWATHHPKLLTAESGRNVSRLFEFPCTVSARETNRTPFQIQIVIWSNDQI